MMKLGFACFVGGVLAVSPLACCKDKVQEGTRSDPGKSAPSATAQNATAKVDFETVTLSGHHGFRIPAGGTQEKSPYQNKVSYKYTTEIKAKVEALIAADGWKTIEKGGAGFKSNWTVEKNGHKLSVSLLDSAESLGYTSLTVGTLD